MSLFSFVIYCVAKVQGVINTQHDFTNTHGQYQKLSNSTLWSVMGILSSKGPRHHH
jgi:hypothetical protein